MDVSDDVFLCRELRCGDDDDDDAAWVVALWSAKTGNSADETPLWIIVAAELLDNGSLLPPSGTGAANRRFMVIRT
jgi:hypothetical protein